MTGIDRNRVKRAFDGHARDYDHHAVVQKRVVNRCLALLEQEKLSPSRILDVGAGTGMLLRSLGNLFPRADLVGLDLALGMGVTARETLRDLPSQVLIGDGEQLPLASSSFDLVVSSSTYQWLESLDAAFAEALRVLKPGGVFLFALFGTATLHELRDSYRRACAALHRETEHRTHTFPAASDAADALDRAGFVTCHVLSERERELHPDVPDLLRALRKIGAGNASSEPRKGLSERHVMQTMMTIYRRDYGEEGGIPACYEVIYGWGRKAVTAGG